MFDFFKSRETYKDAIGKSTWLLLHALADHFPDRDEDDVYQNNLVQFIKSLSFIYPCQICRDHLRSYMENNPPRFENKAHTVRWMFNFHNYVNKDLNKGIMTVQEYIQRLYQYSDVSSDGKCAQCSTI